MSTFAVKWAETSEWPNLSSANAAEVFNTNLNRMGRNIIFFECCKIFRNSGAKSVLLNNLVFTIVLHFKFQAMLRQTSEDIQWLR